MYRWRFEGINFGLHDRMQVEYEFVTDVSIVAVDIDSPSFAVAGDTLFDVHFSCLKEGMSIVKLTLQLRSASVEAVPISW